MTKDDDASNEFSFGRDSTEGSRSKEDAPSEVNGADGI